MLLDEIEHALEASGAAVIGIGYVGVGDKEANLRVMLGGRHASQRLQMAAVHCEDEVELLEVLDTDLPGALRA